MKRILVIILLAVFADGYAQTGQMMQSEDSGIDSDKFPEISFSWNDYSPETRDKTVFTVTDNGVKRDFDMTHSQKQRDKSVLFLWEDMSSNGLAPYSFTRETLLKFFRAADLQSRDRFCISAFGRKFNNKDLLQPLTGGFTSDRNSLAEAVESYRHDTVGILVQPGYSDLYEAVYRGIDLLNAEPKDNVKAIVVFTVGLNLTGGGAKSNSGELTNKAKENRIPVYVALYPAHGTEPEIFIIAEDTYGKKIDYANAKNQLANFYSELNRRHSPRDYIFTFKTDPEKNGKLHNVALSVNGGQKAKFMFSAPVSSLTDRIKENIWPAAGTGAAVMAVAAVIIILMANRRKKKDAAMQVRMNRVQNEANARADEARRETERVRQQQLAYQQEQERKQREAEERSEQEHLADRMRIKNMYPRLQCSVGGNKSVYSVNRPVTAVGRGDGNDLVLPHSTVSGKHAKIVFNGNGFEIFDLNSTNRVTVNGRFAERAMLKNGDIIGLGEAVLIFYL